MRVQDFIANSTQKAVDAFLAQAKRVPEDKLFWSPMEEGRTVMSQLQECAFLMGVMPSILESRTLPEMNPEWRAEMMATREAWDTFEKVEAKLVENSAKNIEVIRSFPDEDLETEMPFFGPTPWKMHDILNMQAWNLHYHTGQICYIQTLLGDKSMQ